MKKSRFTESQIIFALKKSETGVKVEELCPKKGSKSSPLITKKKTDNQ